MTTPDQVRRLIDSHVRGDERSFRRTVEQAAADARRTHKDSLADEFESLLIERGRPERPLAVSTLRPVPLGRDDLPLVVLQEPRTRLDDLVLGPSLVELLQGVLHEQ